MAEAKASLNEFGKGVNDNRLNVGSYGEAIESAFGKISPAMGQAAGGVKMLGNAFKALQANPGCANNWCYCCSSGGAGESL